MPNSVLRYLLDKTQYISLEFSFHPLLFPNKKTETSERAKLFIEHILEKLVTNMTEDS